jgi:hypothetical protein
MIDRHWDSASHGVVARYSEGGFGTYHIQGCIEAPHRGDPGVRDMIRAPWRYLATHWTPCEHCRPPQGEAVSRAA